MGNYTIVYKLDPKIKPRANGNDESKVETGNKFYLFTFWRSDRSAIIEIRCIGTLLMY